MPELKRIRVREAKARDVGLFRKLWKQYLEEQHKNGSFVLPTEANIEAYTNIFKAYVDPEVPEELRQEGIVLFIADVAVIMWGSSGSVIETELGKVAYGWGIYVHPDHRKKGLSTKLHEECIQRLKALGFGKMYSTLLTEEAEAALKRGAETEVHEIKERPVYIDL